MAANLKRLHRAHISAVGVEGEGEYADGSLFAVK